MATSNKFLNKIARFLLRKPPDGQPSKVKAEIDQSFINKTVYPEKIDPDSQTAQIKSPFESRDQLKIERDNKQPEVAAKSSTIQSSLEKANKLDNQPHVSKTTPENIAPDKIKNFLDENEGFLIDYLYKNKRIVDKYLTKISRGAGSPSHTQLDLPVEINGEIAEGRDLVKINVDHAQTSPSASPYLIPEEAQEDKVQSKIISNTEITPTSNTSPPQLQGIKNDSNSAVPFSLDRERIAGIEVESKRGELLLTEIFDNPENSNDIDVELADQITGTPAQEKLELPTILGLDANLSELANRILDRPQWSRAELVLITNSLDLMLDGALEAINEASYDNLDMPLLEGDDPIEINPEVISILKS